MEHLHYTLVQNLALSIMIIMGIFNKAGVTGLADFINVNSKILKGNIAMSEICYDLQTQLVKFTKSVNCYVY